MKKKLPIKVILNRMTIKNSKGEILTGDDITRPFSFELRVGRMVMTGPWLSNIDSKSAEYFKTFVDALTNRDDIEIEIR